jgi:MoaA/NifB/PqqE/SkfB family radical SAM enzyme
LNQLPVERDVLKARLREKAYSKVHIEISNICNLQCSFCPEVIRSKKLIDLDLFRKIVKEVSPLTEQVCFHLMGDPLVHPKLAELVEITHEYGAKIFFVTNGVLLREKQAELLLHPAFRQVNFSLHSFADNFPERDPTEYLERIFAYTEAAFVKRPDLYINYRLWNLNDTRGTSTDNREILNRVEARFGAKVPEDLDVRLKKSVNLKNRLYLHFDTEFIWPSLDLPVLGTKGTCYGLSSHFGILVDGTVVPCCLDKEGAIPLGKIQDQSIGEILDNPRSKAVLAGFKARKLVENLCQRCQYIERFQR